MVNLFRWIWYFFHCYSFKLLPMCNYLWIHDGKLAGKHADPFYAFYQLIICSYFTMSINRSAQRVKAVLCFAGTTVVSYESTETSVQPCCQRWPRLWSYWRRWGRNTSLSLTRLGLCTRPASNSWRTRWATPRSLCACPRQVGVYSQESSCLIPVLLSVGLPWS